MTLVPPKEFVRTYDPRAYADPWECLEDYQRTIELAAEQPNLGSAALATRLELPRSRIRPWVREESPARPDCVRGQQIAEEKGWVSVDPDSSIFEGLNVLVAWIYSGGSIGTKYYVPHFSIDRPENKHRVGNAMDLVDAAYRVNRSDESKRATEIVPTDHASILGRVLTVLGAPIGEKAAQPLRLPDYLDAVDDTHREQFAITYLLNRGQEKDESDVITLHEERSNSYINELAHFFGTVGDAPARRSGENVIISAEAAREICSGSTIEMK